MKYTHQVTVRLTPEIFEALSKIVEQNNLSLNIEIINILQTALGKNDNDQLCSEAISSIKNLDHYSKYLR